MKGSKMGRRSLGLRGGFIGHVSRRFRGGFIGRVSRRSRGGSTGHGRAGAEGTELARPLHTRDRFEFEHEGEREVWEDGADYNPDDVFYDVVRGRGETVSLCNETFSSRPKSKTSAPSVTSTLPARIPSNVKEEVRPLVERMEADIVRACETVTKMVDEARAMRDVQVALCEQMKDSGNRLYDTQVGLIRRVQELEQRVAWMEAKDHAMWQYYRGRFEPQGPSGWYGSPFPPDPPGSGGAGSSYPVS